MLRRDLVLGSIFLGSGLLVSFQLAVFLLQPPWRTAVTDWLRTGLAWPEMLTLGLVALWCMRTHHPGARTWWMLCAALFAYAIGQSVWTVLDQFIIPGRIPVPSWPDLFFLLQYPFFFLSLARPLSLSTRGQTWLTHLKVMVDGLLMMSAFTALSWYFLLVPIYLASNQPLGGKVTNLAYPMGDVAVFFGLILMLVPLYRQGQAERITLHLLMAATICLVIADSSFTSRELHARYRPGGFSDIFWMACYLLFPLAGLTYFRLKEREPGRPPGERLERRRGPRIHREDLLESFRVLLPVLAAMLAGMVIEFHAMSAPLHAMDPLAPHLVVFGLLLLVLIRQELVSLEQALLRRQREEARTTERAMREAKEQLETFLGMASHELKTPLTSIGMGLQMIERRITRLVYSLPEDAATSLSQAETVQALAETTRQQGERLNRLVNDLLDTSRIQAGRLNLQRKSTDLALIARLAVEEQRQATPERIILLHQPTEPVSLWADAGRIGQVVTNFLTNALKYSDEEQPVEVGVEGDGRHGCGWVRDQGPGIPPDEQEYIWERFYRVRGIEVQSGSGVGLGLGLHISKTIIEQHGGKVGVQSSPGHGSTFWFTVPLAVPGQGEGG